MIGTAKILPILEPTSWSATVSWMLTKEQETPGSETKDLLLLFHQATRTSHSHQFSLSPKFHQFSSVQSFSHVQLFATPSTAAHQASLSITSSRSLLKLMFIESVMPSSHLILCHPPFLLPSIFPSIRVFSDESVLHIRWPKCWSFSFSVSPSKEYSGLISFRMDWLDLLAVQGTLKSLLQHHSSKASIFRHSAFFTVQLSHPYMTTGKTIALTKWTFASKVMFLLLNMLSRLVITFLPRSECLSISWLQSPSAVILEPKKVKSDTISPSSSHEVMGPDAMILVFWMLASLLLSIPAHLDRACRIWGLPAQQLSDSGLHCFLLSTTAYPGARAQYSIWHMNDQLQISVQCKVKI